MDALLRLEELGLSRNEAKAYLELWRSGGTSAGALSHRTGINRRSCYDALFSLREKGLVGQSSTDDGKALFLANGPDAFYALLRERETLVDELAAALPRRGVLPQEPLVETFYGIAAAKGVFEGLLQCGKTIYIYGGYNPAKTDFRYYYPKFTQRRERAGIRVRALHVDVPGMRELVAELPLWDARFLDHRQLSPSFWWLQGNRVFLIFWREQPVIVRVTDDHLAKTYLHSFRALWATARR